MKSSRHTILFGLSLCATLTKNYRKDHTETHQTCGLLAQPIFNITYFSSADPFFFYMRVLLSFLIAIYFSTFSIKYLSHINIMSHTHYMSNCTKTFQRYNNSPPYMAIKIVSVSTALHGGQKETWFLYINFFAS